MKILIGGSSSKIFHLNEFAQNLIKKNVETKVVFDSEFSDGFPSRKIRNWFNTNRKFFELTEKFKPDVIFVDRTRHFALDATKTNIPLVIHLRGDHWAELIMAKKTLYKSTVKKIALKKWETMGEECFDKSKMILPICNYLSEITKKRYSKKPIETLYQGITPSNWFHVEGMQLKHPCVGILQSATIWEKTKELLTLTSVLKKMPDVHFYWVGDGVYRDEVLPKLQKFNNFHWLGALEYPNKVREFLSEIDVYALISGIDMSPLTLQEAQLMKKPVIATNVGGIPELMINEKTGYLVIKNKPDELFEKISILINDQQNAKIMGENGNKFVKENFSWEKISDYFLNHLKKYEIGEK